MDHFRLISSAAIILTFFFNLPASPQDSSFFSSSEMLLERQDYGGAGAVVARRLLSAPEDNYALYLQTVIRQTEMLDYESYDLQGGRFIIMADSIRKVLEGRMRKLSGKDSMQCLLYRANIYGGISVVKAKTGSWLSSLKSALTSVALLKEVLRRDSTMQAASLGIGVFHYYLSKSFKWLPFIDENSENEGIREVEKAVASPFPFNFAAKNSLCWILIERKQFARADSVALSALRDSPESTIFLRIRCLIALWSGHNKDAVALGEKLAQLTQKRDSMNWSDLVLSYYVIICGNDAQGKHQEACTAADYILSAKIPPEYSSIPPVKKNIKRILAVKNKCQSLK